MKLILLETPKKGSAASRPNCQKHDQDFRLVMLALDSDAQTFKSVSFLHTQSKDAGEDKGQNLDLKSRWIHQDGRFKGFSALVPRFDLTHGELVTFDKTHIFYEELFNITNRDLN